MFFPPLALFGVWLGSVVVFTRSGQSGIICMTPVVWLLALVAGLGVLNYSRSRRPAILLREAAIAGALYGSLTGLLYFADVWIIDKVETGISWFAVWSGGLCILSGTVICALAAAGITALSLRKRGRPNNDWE